MNPFPVPCLAGFHVELPDGDLRVRCSLMAHGEQGHRTASGFEFDSVNGGQPVVPGDPGWAEVVKECHGQEARYLAHLAAIEAGRW